MIIVKQNVIIFLLLLLYACTGRIDKQILIKAESSNSNEIKVDTSKFNLIYLDFDDDGDLDNIYSSKFLKGDSLYIYRNVNNRFELSLRTTNFTEDGLFMLDSIRTVNSDTLGGIIIYNHFNGAGGLKRIMFLKFYKPNGWKLTRYIGEKSKESINKKIVFY